MGNKSCVITTAYKPDKIMADRAEAAAEELRLVYAERGNLSLAEITQSNSAKMALVLARTGWILHTEGGELFFHLNMANLRLKNIALGQGDHMVKAMRLAPGMTVLDCTLGLASDAIVASFVSGATGVVCGIEANPYTAFIVREGLQHFAAEGAITAALHRIEVMQGDYLDYLHKQPDNAFDIVYFDPMFRHPIQESIHLKPLRSVADHSEVSALAIKEAGRVARQRVVFKENSRSGEFARLAFDYVTGGKYSSVHYGVIEIDEKK